jgi:hypothetical protein
MSLASQPVVVACWSQTALLPVGAMVRNGNAVWGAGWLVQLQFQDINLWSFLSYF